MGAFTGKADVKGAFRVAGGNNVKEEVTHVALVVVGGGRSRGRSRGDDSLTRTLQAGWEIPEHGGVSHWRELVMT